MIYIEDGLINTVSSQAKQSQRKRKNHNFHKDPSDLLQRMLNAMEPGTYVRPHKHENPDKREAFILLRGRVMIVEFDNTGRVVSQVVLDKEKGIYGVEIPPGIYHTIVSLESGSVVYEIKDGPYDVQNDKGFAPWAPEEGSPEAFSYLSNLLISLS